MMAGAYVGVGIILILTLGNDADPASRNLIMGCFFGIALALIISLLNPGSVSELTDTSTGRTLIAFAIGAMVVGIIWIRRIVTLEF